MIPDLALLDFETAGRAVLSYLHERLGFGTWLLTRTDGKDWLVLQADDHNYGISPGLVLPWAESLCFVMVQGKGPRVAPDTDLVPAYALAPVGSQLSIKSYIGVPLTSADGAIFGTLCAFDPAPQPQTILQEQGQVELIAALLSAILRLELSKEYEHRRNERLELEAQTDPMTQLANRRAWDQLMLKEEERCLRYGHSASLFSIDLDELKEVNDSLGHTAGDELIQRTAEALRAATREVDIIARLGGDEFGIIAVECDRVGAETLLARLRQALVTHDVKASVGFAVRTPSRNLTAAWEQADENMFQNKRARKNQPAP